jgi:hypothetical protein
VLLDKIKKLEALLLKEKKESLMKDTKIQSLEELLKIKES